MGKCLSCCPHAVISQTRQDTFLDPPQPVEQPPATCDFRRCGDRPQPEPASNSTPGSQPPTSETNANVKPMSLTEKLKLPILGGLDAKRSSHSKEREVASEARQLALFLQYAEEGGSAMGWVGIERLCTDLAVQPDDFRVLLLAWQCRAKAMCCFTREEFLRGCRALRADSVQDMQIRLPELAVEVGGSGDRFKDLYRFTFGFGLEPHQRTLPLDVAVQLWRLVFSNAPPPPMLTPWLKFLGGHAGVRGISRDTWDMFRNFCEAVGEDLSTYDETAAWPSLLDDFVEHHNDHTNQNIVLPNDC